MRRLKLASLCTAVLTTGSVVGFAAEKPKVPAGKPTATEPSVAIVGAGLDYTRAEVASALRRDAELEIVGWDFVDNDRRPFDGKSNASLPGTSDRNGTGTRLASVLAGKMLLIPIRIDPANPQSLAKGMGFAARTSVRVVLMPNIAANPANWNVLLAAALEFPNQLFIAAADEALAADVAQATWKTARALPNVVVVGGEQTGSSSDNRDKDAWRTFIHVAPCGNGIHQLQQSDKPLALGAIATMAQLAVRAQAATSAPDAPQGADLKQRLLRYIADDLAQQSAPTEKTMKTWVASGFAKQAIEAGRSDPATSSWRLWGRVG
jgi:hypothetical protein